MYAKHHLEKKTVFFKDPHSSYLPRVVRTAGDAKLWMDEGVVNEVTHILEGFAIVFTDTDTRLQWDIEDKV